MRARLGKGGRGTSFRAICDAEMVGHLERVITWAGGLITALEEHPDGTVLHILKQQADCQGSSK
ncbi:MAG: hypothetical protein ABFS18_09600 [Thermodesulfobacteriota bacterium]